MKRSNLTEERVLLICECHSLDHMMAISVLDWGEEYPPEMDIQIHLRQTDNVWKRIVRAFRHIFNYKCRYGAFDEFLFGRKTASKFQEAMNLYLEMYDEYEKKNGHKWVEPRPFKAVEDSD